MAFSLAKLTNREFTLVKLANVAADLATGI